mmetsp:Transcript_19675/g.54767  ORF Transcript_19675/g.54767 Transcript_19675/m.54767 type:complete len:698 (+) Transcript_19675:134-2227(+)
MGLHAGGVKCEHLAHATSGIHHWACDGSSRSGNRDRVISPSQRVEGQGLRWGRKPDVRGGRIASNRGGSAALGRGNERGKSLAAAHECEGHGQKSGELRRVRDEVGRRSPIPCDLGLPGLVKVNELVVIQDQPGANAGQDDVQRDADSLVHLLSVHQRPQEHEDGDGQRAEGRLDQCRPDVIVHARNVLLRPTPETGRPAPGVNGHVQVVEHGARKVEDGIHERGRVIGDAFQPPFCLLLHAWDRNRALGEQREDVVRGLGQLLDAVIPEGHHQPIKPRVLAREGDAMDSLEGDDEGVGQLEQHSVDFRPLEVLQQGPHGQVVHHEDDESENCPHGPRRLPQAALLPDGVDHDADLHRTGGRVRGARPGVALALEASLLPQREQGYCHQEHHEGVLDDAADARCVVRDHSIRRPLEPRGQASEGLTHGALDLRHLLRRILLREADVGLHQLLGAEDALLEELHILAEGRPILAQNLLGTLAFEVGLQLDRTTGASEGRACFQAENRENRVGHANCRRDANPGNGRGLRAVLRRRRRLARRIPEGHAHRNAAVPEDLGIALLFHGHVAAVREAGQQTPAAPGHHDGLLDLRGSDLAPEFLLFDGRLHALHVRDLLPTIKYSCGCSIGGIGQPQRRKGAGACKRHRPVDESGCRGQTNERYRRSQRCGEEPSPAASTVLGAPGRPGRHGHPMRRHFAPA